MPSGSGDEQNSNAKSVLPRRPLPLHVRVKQDLEAQIDNGTFQPGDMIPSERELCAQYGVSNITIRRALSELANEGRVIRQVGVGTFVTSFRKRERLGLIVFGFDEDDWHRNRDIFGDLIGGIASAAWHQEAVFSLVRAPLNAPVAALLESLIGEKLFDGFILRTAGDFSALDVAPLLRAGIPFVLVKRSIDGLQVNCAVVDELQGGYLATRYLIELGHRRIAFIGPTSLSIGRLRYQGYLRALAEAGLSPVEELVQVIPTFRQHDAFEATRRLLDRGRPTAVFASADVLAEGTYQACAEAGLRIPQDLSVVGHDDYSAATRLNPPLTTVRISYQDLGAKATEVLLDVLRSHSAIPQCCALTPTLVVRESTAPLAH